MFWTTSWNITSGHHHCQPSLHPQLFFFFIYVFHPVSVFHIYLFLFYFIFYFWVYIYVFLHYLMIKIWSYDSFINNHCLCIRSLASKKLKAIFDYHILLIIIGFTWFLFSFLLVDSWKFYVVLSLWVLVFVCIIAIILMSSCSALSVCDYNIQSCIDHGPWVLAFRTSGLGIYERKAKPDSFFIWCWWSLGTVANAWGDFQAGPRCCSINRKRGPFSCFLLHWSWLIMGSSACCKPDQESNIKCRLEGSDSSLATLLF